MSDCVKGSQRPNAPTRLTSVSHRVLQSDSRSRWFCITPVNLSGIGIAEWAHSRPVIGLLLFIISRRNCPPRSGAPHQTAMGLEASWTLGKHSPADFTACRQTALELGPIRVCVTASSIAHRARRQTRFALIQSTTSAPTRLGPTQGQFLACTKRTHHPFGGTTATS